MSKPICEICGCEFSELDRSVLIDTVCNVCGTSSTLLGKSLLAQDAAWKMLSTIIVDLKLDVSDKAYYAIRLSGEERDNCITLFICPLIVRDNQYRAYNAMLKAAGKDAEVKTVRGDYLVRWLMPWWAEQHQAFPDEGLTLWYEQAKARR